MATHHWRAYDPDGKRRHYQAKYFSSKWSFYIRDRQRTEWEPLIELERRHWDDLRETMFNKYQRHRIPWEHIEALDELIKQLPEDPSAPAPVPSEHAAYHSAHADPHKVRQALEEQTKDTENSHTPLNTDTQSSSELPAWQQNPELPAQDQQYLWHPFTPQEHWQHPANPPLTITRAEGSYLYDQDNKAYFDGNASIWTNIHGHRHPHITQAIINQLQQLDHTSFLGTTHPQAIRLAQRLIAWANGLGDQPVDPAIPEHFEEDDGSPFSRVFYSDNGSTAIEVALRLAIQVRQAIGQEEKTHFIAFDHAYHGDTVGAASVSGISSFFERFRHYHFPCTPVSSFAALRSLPEDIIDQATAIVIEPGIQGVNQMTPWPKGMLRQLRHFCNDHGLLLIFDEVLTGFGRSGSMFASHTENIRPDMLCLAKGITGGTLPLAATLVTDEIYQALLDPEHTLYYGHSYTANPPACAAANANLDLFEQDQAFPQIRRKIDLLAALLTSLKAQQPSVHQTRQYGIISGIELRHPDGTPFDPEHRVGAQVCQAARAHGLLTRPIHDTIVMLPPLNASEQELRGAFNALREAIAEVMS